MGRVKVPDKTQVELLTKSRRRCALCWGINSDITEKNGQIAHLNQKNDDNKLDNLVWLCLDHHDKYDSKTRQTKNYTLNEVKSYRDSLYVELDKMDVPQNIKPALLKFQPYLQQIMKEIDFINLPVYISDFPYHFNCNLAGASDVWGNFKLSARHIYPTNDTKLDRLFDEFFSIHDAIENYMFSILEVEDKETDFKRRYPLFQPISENKRWNLNKELPYDTRVKLVDEFAELKPIYQKAHYELTQYIRNVFPKLELNVFKDYAFRSDS